MNEEQSLLVNAGFYIALAVSLGMWLTVCGCVAWVLNF